MPNATARATTGEVRRDLIAPLAGRIGGPVTALRVLQEHHGWIDGDAIDLVADVFNLSRADVRGKALYEDGIWTLELGRRLNTTDALHDVTFDPGSGREYVFTVAVMDNSDREQRGSSAQILVFDPPAEER